MYTYNIKVLNQVIAIAPPFSPTMDPVPSLDPVPSFPHTHHLCKPETLGATFPPWTVLGLEM